MNSDQISKGWLSLFDSYSLYGWRREVSADWKVLDETIHVSKGGIGLLRTPVQFDDFELQLEFKASEETNSWGLSTHQPTAQIRDRRMYRN